jgi:hypothetical protein
MRQQIAKGSYWRNNQHGIVVEILKANGHIVEFKVVNRHTMKAHSRHYLTPIGTFLRSYQRIPT